MHASCPEFPSHRVNRIPHRHIDNKHIIFFKLRTPANKCLIIFIGNPCFVMFRFFAPQSRQSAKLFLQSSELGLSQPRRAGWGESQFRRGTYCTLCYSLYMYMYFLLCPFEAVVYKYDAVISITRKYSYFRRGDNVV